MGKFFDALKKSDSAETRPEKATAVKIEPVELEDILLDPEESISAAAQRPSPRSITPQETTQPDRTFPQPEARRSRPAPVQGKPDPRLVTHFRPQSFEAEQFRMLRTNILFPSNGKPVPRTILVTSVLPGEGKSFVSSNLAVTISQNIDKHVLLIDCDTRHPSIHRIFGYGMVPGLSNYLTGEYALPDLLIRTGNRHLSILPAGPEPSNPAELLSSNRMLAMLREVRSRYDDRFIVIDSPPPQLTAESKALTQVVDAILVVVKFGETSREMVSQLVEKLPKEKILGLVANWLDRRVTSAYGSGKYAQYGYHRSNN